MRPSFTWMAPTLTAVGHRFGFDAHYFAKNTAIVTLSHSISMLKGVITGYLVTRLFPPEMYGEYRFVLGVMGAIGVIGLPGLATAIGGALARKESVSLVRTVRWYSSISAVGSLVLFGCIFFLPRWGRAELWPLFMIASLLFVPSSIATNLYGGVIRGTGSFGAAFRLSLLSNVLVMSAVLVMLLAYPSSVLLLAIVSGIPAVIFLGGLIPFERRFRTNESQKNLRHTALHLSIATIPSSISWYVDSLIISAFFGLNQLALFSVALLIPEQVKVWMKEIFPIFFSRQAKGDDTPERRKKMHQAVLSGTALFALGIALYVAIAPLIMPILFPQYPQEELILLTRIAALTLIVSPASLYPQFLEARNMTKAIHISNWTASAAFLLALVTLVPVYGPLGAIISRGVFRFLYAIIAFGIVQRTPTKA